MGLDGLRAQPPEEKILARIFVLHDGLGSYYMGLTALTEIDKEIYC